jgi:hypothetical protein
MDNVQYQISAFSTDFREIGCEARTWVELAEENVQ